MPSTPNFTKADVLRGLLSVKKEISRADLTKELNLGEGTIRSILGILKGKGLITSTRQGHLVTKDGKALLKRINENIEIKNFSSKIFGKNKKTALLLKKYDKNIKIDYKLRDIAVKNKAEGALIFLFDGKLIIPDYDEKNFNELNKLFDYKNKNILIITFADSYKASETAAIKVAESVNKSLKRIVDGSP